MFAAKKAIGFKKLALTTLTLLGTSFLSLEIDASPVLARDPVDAVCPNRLEVNNSSELKVPYCANKLLNSGETPDTTVKRAVIVVHGTNRNADDYYDRMRDAAIKAGKLDETIIISPQFLLEEDKNKFNFGEDFLHWTNGGWKRGDKSRSANERTSSFVVANYIMSRLADKNAYPNLESITIAGHSAGGQYTHRLAFGSKETGIPTRYIVANPSSYLYLDNKRRVEGTLDRFQIPTDKEVSNCRDYNEYKYGFEDINSYLEGVGEDKAKQQYAQRKVVYLLGEEDNDPNSSSLDKDCPAMLQGKHRFERGTIYYNYIQQLYGSSITANHSKVTVPGVGHSSSKMFNSDEGVQIIFDTADIPPAPTSYEEKEDDENEKEDDENEKEDDDNEQEDDDNEKEDDN